MTRRAHPAIGVLLVATVACSVRGTDIRPVAPTPPAAFENATDTALATTEPVDAWWTTFQDARMTSLVEQALARSPDVRQATALVRLARARMREQEGANWPVGGAAARFDRSRSQAGLPPVSNADLFDAGVDASWEVDIFGARRAAIAGARADFARERSLRRLTLVSMAAEVVLAYADIRGTQIASGRRSRQRRQSGERRRADRATAQRRPRDAARCGPRHRAPRVDTRVDSTTHRSGVGGHLSPRCARRHRPTSTGSRPARARHAACAAE